MSFSQIIIGVSVFVLRRYWTRHWHR